MERVELITISGSDWSVNEASLRELEKKEFDQVFTSLYVEANADLNPRSLSLKLEHRKLIIEGLMSSINGELFVLLAFLSCSIDLHFSAIPDLLSFKFIGDIVDLVVCKPNEFPPLNLIINADVGDNFVENLLRPQTGVSKKIKELNSLRDIIRDTFEAISVRDVVRRKRQFSAELFVKQTRLLVADLKAKKPIELQKTQERAHKMIRSQPSIAIPLATIQKNGDLQLANEGIAYLQTCDFPLFALTVIGPARSGKSSLLSFLYGEEDSFAVSPSVNPETRGFWIAVKEISFSDREKIGLLLIDTEGLYDTDNGPEISRAITRFSFLLSNLLVFNANKIYDTNDLQVLIEGSCFVFSQESLYPEILMAVRNCSLQDRPLLISEIAGVPSRHKKAFLSVQRRNNIINTILFPIPTVESGNIDFGSTSLAFQKEFSEFQAQVMKSLKENTNLRLLNTGKDLAKKIQLYVQQVNSSNRSAIDELLDAQEMRTIAEQFKVRLAGISKVDFETKADTILAGTINELKKFFGPQREATEAECRKLFECCRKIALERIEHEMQKDMTGVKNATNSGTMQSLWKDFSSKYSFSSKLPDYESQYKNLYRALALAEEQKRFEEETRMKLEQLRLDEEKRRREEERRAAELQRQFEENQRRAREFEELKERQRREALLQQQQLMYARTMHYVQPSYSPANSYSPKNYGSYNDSPTKRTYHCSNCGRPGHNIRTCPRY